jgi:glycosyltransferase involved in cell wall biosynthesis
VELTVVLLAHNEASVIADEIRSFNEAILRRLPDAELVVAEDGSRDGTRDRIIAVSSEIPLRLLGGQERLGYQRAVLNALSSTSAEWVCLFDSGLKHDPGDFWKLWDVREGYDLILGHRTNREDQWYRRLFTYGLNFVVRRLFGVRYRDCDTGMRLLRRPVVDTILRSNPFFTGFGSTEIVLRAHAAGFRITEVPTSYRQRVGASRGVPTRAIPRLIFRVINDLRKLRNELRAS